MNAKYAGNCHRCEGAIEPGNRIYYDPRAGKAYCAGCGNVLEQNSKWHKCLGYSPIQNPEN